MGHRCVRSLAAVLLTVVVAATAATPADAEVRRGFFFGALLTATVHPVISGNGRFLAAIDAARVCPWLVGFPPGVIVRDLHTSTVECVSVDSAGIGRTGAAGTFRGPAISADGERVVFIGNVSDLDPRCPHVAGSPGQVFLRNRRTRKTTCISVSDAGLPASGGVTFVQISATGNLVAFSTAAGNLVPGDANGSEDIYAVPLVDGASGGAVERITTGPGGGGDGALASVQPELSADGRYVVFVSDRTGLVPDDRNGASDVFRHDRRTGETIRVSVSGSGREANRLSLNPAVSADGRFVSFASWATHLVDAATLPVNPQIYRRDLLTGAMLLVSRGPSGAFANGACGDTDISADGRAIVFRSRADNLVEGDTNQKDDVFGADLTDGVSRVSRVSLAIDGVTQRDGPAVDNELSDPRGSDVSADGSVVVFASNAQNLAPGGGNLFVARIPGVFSGVLTGAGMGGGPHVRALGLDGQSDAWRELFAYHPGFTGGVTVASGDVDGDGAPDIVTGAGPGGGPHVRVFSAARHAVPSDGAVAAPNQLASFFAYDPAFAGGVSVAIADVTGDGIGDIITGAGPGGGPHVRVFQVQTSWDTGTATLTEYASFFAFQPGFAGGVRVATGDLDGDGVSEILTAAGPGGGPHVRAFKFGGGGELIPVLSFFAYDASFGGGVFVAAGNVDGDGRDEIITGADAGGGPHVRVLAVGAGFSSLTETDGFFAYDPHFAGGVRVAAGDLDGDGRADVITAPGPGGAPLIRAFFRPQGSGMSELGSFFAYGPGFVGGVFVAAPH